MANKIQRQKPSGMSNPVFAMIVMAIVSGLLVGAAFQVIVWWPLPLGVAPYFEDSLFPTGFAWGFIVGGFFGWLIGYMTDESHFIDATYE